MDKNYILKVENLSKAFPGVQALDNVLLQIESGKIHALMGENGAGKSTLIKILMGLLTADSGDIFIRDKKVKFTSVKDASNAGLSMIHQELMPFPNLTVAENIFMGKEPTTWISWCVNKREMNRKASALMKTLGVQTDVTLLMKELSIAEMQMVEIAKAISNNARVIFMDEPTSAISDREVRILFKIIRELKMQGIAIVYISHKMDEILEIADSITVMRDGHYIGTYDKSEVDKNKLISLIVGRELNSIFEKRKSTLGEEVLSVRGLTGLKFKDISFRIRRGEILGIAGLMGSGRTEIVSALFGLEKITEGEIILKGRKIKINTPRDAIKYGIGLVSEDRKNFGLILSSSVKMNITISNLKKIVKGLFINIKKEERLVDQQIQNFNIKTTSRNFAINLLSGGNQQKVVLAKVLLNDPDIIILDEPTKGIDIGAKTEIYKLISRLGNDGKAIILISSELPEVLGMSDRILVIKIGALKAELDAEDASQELVMKHSMS